jgi:4-aminobutyrate aminotransferase-like enzyme/Ser/Thr protein kinase RdoA (MazF antagonist)
VTDHSPSRATGFDFFATGELPAPLIDVAEAERLVAERFGRTVTARSLGSQQDANFLLRDASAAPAPESGGEVAPLGVLKVSNGAFGEVEIEAQDAAAALLARELPHVRVATVLPHPVSGEPARVVRPGSAGEIARIVRYLEGGTLTGSGYLRPQVVEALGALSGTVNRALAGFTHAGVHRTLQWDLRHATRVIDELVHHVGDAHRRRAVELVRERDGAAVAALAERLPVQVIHGDITDDNVVRSVPETGAGAGEDLGIGRVPDGIIDFGDLNTGWAVAELAVTVSSVLHHAGATPASVLPAVRAFHEERPLSADEIDALWPLVLLRGAVLVVSGWQQAAIDGENEYATSALEHEWRILENALTVPSAVMAGMVRAALGIGAPALALPSAPGPLFRGSVTAGVEVLDLSVDVDAMDEGAWLDRGLEESLAADRLRLGAAAVATVHLQPRATRSVPLSPTAPLTVPTGVDAWFASATELLAPWSGRLRALPEAAGRGGVVLTAAGGGVELRLTVAAGSSRPGAAVPADGVDVAVGDPLLTVPAAERVRVTVTSARAGEVPEFVTAAEAPGWRTILADPHPLLDPTVGADPEPAFGGGGAELVRRREQHFASVQEHYYREPPRIERGWRHTLLDSDGRSHLDMVNNVAALGHAHPGVERAVSRQLRRLNTNSRFNYGSVVEFSERLTELLPPELDTVFLVNSGSEAVDLALRIALATTERTDLLAVSEAYHGWTLASDAVSTSVADNPQALETRPEWVHTLDAPNGYRGRYRGTDDGRYAEDAVDRIRALAEAGRPLAGFIAEAYYGNAGGMALPEGYLRQVYAAVREQGGLVIADEVQVGYGRLGEWFWGFEQQGVVPDIVTVAKAMGNGHPLGAVVTSRAVAERYRNQGYFFSSAGGSPVSSVVGLAVLDALRDEGLQENARVVGAHLKGRLEQLALKHPLIGAVHGSGLYLGVELVRDRVTREPATAETAAICERMLELGVVIQPTGDRLCVLKTKPPLCLDELSADHFVDALDEVLSTGW